MKKFKYLLSAGLLMTAMLCGCGKTNTTEETTNALVTQVTTTENTANTETTAEVTTKAPTTTTEAPTTEAPTTTEAPSTPGVDTDADKAALSSGIEDLLTNDNPIGTGFKVDENGMALDFGVAFRNVENFENTYFNAINCDGSIIVNKNKETKIDANIGVSVPNDDYLAKWFDIEAYITAGNELIIGVPSYSDEFIKVPMSVATEGLETTVQTPSVDLSLFEDMSKKLKEDIMSAVSYKETITNTVIGSTNYNWTGNKIVGTIDGAKLEEASQNMLDTLVNVGFSVEKNADGTTAAEPLPALEITYSVDGNNKCIEIINVDENVLFGYIKVGNNSCIYSTNIATGECKEVFYTVWDSAREGKLFINTGAETPITASIGKYRDSYTINNIEGMSGAFTISEISYVVGNSISISGAINTEGLVAGFSVSVDNESVELYVALDENGSSSFSFYALVDNYVDEFTIPEAKDAVLEDWVTELITNNPKLEGPLKEGFNPWDYPYYWE